ncbi:MAG: hypothetical protein QM778_22390 [Myxococcales bacterium]
MRVLVAALVLVLAWPALGRAHGVPAAVTGVIAEDEQGPWLVRLTEGLARRGEAGWEFVCPALFGGYATLLAASARNEYAFVVGSGGSYRLYRDGLPELVSATRTAFTLRAVGAMGERIVALEVAEVGTALVDVDSAQGPDAVVPLWMDEKRWDALGTDGSTLWILRVVGSVLEVATLSSDFVEQGRVPYPLSAPVVLAEVRPSPGALYAHVMRTEADADLVELTPSGARLVVQAYGPIQGPLSRPQGALWISAAGELRAIDALEAVLPVFSQPVTCLEPGRLAPYLCTSRYVLGLDALEERDARFDLGRLLEPNVQPVDLQQAKWCVDQWQTFERDLRDAHLRTGFELDAGAPREQDAGLPDASAEPMHRPESPSSCTLAHGARASGVWSGLLLGLLAWALQRRQRLLGMAEIARSRPVAPRGAR